MVGGIRFMKWMMGCSGKFCEFCIYVRFSSALLPSACLFNLLCGTALVRINNLQEERGRR